MNAKPEESLRALAASVVFALVGVGVGIAAITLAVPLESDGPLIMSAIAVLVFVFALSWLALRRDPRRQRKLRALVLPLALGALGVGPGMLILLNALGDVPDLRSVEVVSRRAHTSRNTTRYYLTVAPFPPISEPLELQVELEQYEQCPPGTAGALRTGPGRLGIPYVVRRWGTAELRCASSAR